MTPAARRDLLNELFAAALSGSAAGPATATAVAGLPLEGKTRVFVFAIGKAAHAMAAAAVPALQRMLHPVAGGLVVSPEAVQRPIGPLTSIRGDHPLPGRGSFAAAQRLGDLTRGMRSTDAAVVLLSGGTTSLVGAPLRGAGEGDLVELYEMLLTSGLPIGEVNAVRKRFIRWGGGRLALALAPATVHCLVISDVIGDDLTAIGSGPCVPDPSTAREVQSILERHALLGRLPAPFRRQLDDMSRGLLPETPKRTHPAFAHVTARVILSNRQALDAVAACARARGFDAEVAAEPLCGEAAAVGQELGRELTTLRGSRTDAPRPLVRVWGGETTVRLASASSPVGGRCQELALAAARYLDWAGADADGVALLAAGTDGRDGPTDAAGAAVDGGTWRTIRDMGHDPERALAAHASTTVLEAAGALVRTGPTGTNVMDVVIGVVGNRDRTLFDQ
ncbi:MAG: glycerate kinase type-2 family protein [Gemmatimonadaceae bacterium]